MTKQKKNQNIEQRITRARSNIIMDSPFFGSLLVKLEPVVNNSEPTMCTDGNAIYYNEDFVSKLNDSEIKGVIVHEVMHCALAHHARIGERQHRRWNMACDYAINQIVVDSGFVLPKGGLLDPAYKDMSAEEIYAKLPEDDGGNGDGSGDGWNFGGVRKSNAKTKDEVEQEVEKWKQSLAEAARAAKMMGDLPANLERMVDEQLNSRLPWQELLARFMHAVTKNDFNWARPQKAMLINYGLYLPSLHSDACGSVALAIDTSGSIGGKELSEFAAELNGVLEQVRPEKVVVIYCDAQVGNVEEFTPDQYPVSLKPTGGGGTAFEPVFDYVAENVQDAQCLIYLTDMYGSFPSEKPDIPTLWVSNSEIKDAPFGQVVQLKH